jgi:hypothetical protein
MAESFKRNKPLSAAKASTTNVHFLGKRLKIVQYVTALGYS